eukprot:195024-Prorocentrum_minimum.AAC.1
MTSFYGSSCANNGKDALNTPDAADREYSPRATNRTPPTENIPHGRPTERRRLRIFHGSAFCGSHQNSTDCVDFAASAGILPPAPALSFHRRKARRFVGQNGARRKSVSQERS